MHLLALFLASLYVDRNDRFRYLFSYTSASEIPTFHIPEAVKKVPLYVIIGSNPPGDQMQPVNVHRAIIFSAAREDKGAKLLYPLLSVGIVKSVYKNGIFGPLALKR